MKEEKIDYNSKVLNFMAMTETGDPDVATKYLESSNWDETIAVNNFFNKIKVNSNQNKNNNNIIKYNNNNSINKISMGDSNDNIIKEKIDLNFSNNINQHLIDKNTNNNINNNVNNNLNTNNNKNESDNQNCFIKYIIEPIISIFSCCCNKKDDLINQEENKFNQLLPNVIINFTQFCESIKNKIGIIILYKSQNVQFLNRFISQLTQNPLLLNSLKEKCVIFSVLSNSQEGIIIQNIINNNQLIYPIFFFCYKISKNQLPLNYNKALEKRDIIYKLESESITLDTFYNTLMDTSEKFNNKNFINNNNSNINGKYRDNFNALTDAEVLNQQKSEMEALERQVQKKEEELKQKKLIEEQKKLEEEIFKQNEAKKLEELKKKVVEEPDEGDPDATTISFRYPDGEKRKDRRFLKSHTIQNLYEFVASLGKEIYTEEENNSFSLYQPFPPKKFENMNSTLENEGLFPNAIIQIREEEKGQ